MLDRDKLEAFATVIEEQSFEQAAKTLKITRSAVSQRVRALEEGLGCVLVVRAKPLVATEQGNHLLRHVQALRMMENETRQLINGGDSQASKIALGVNADSLATWFRPVLKQLHQDLQVSVELAVDDQEHTAQLLHKGEVMGCVSVEKTPPSGFDVVPLGFMRYLCLATEDYAAEHFAEGMTLAAVLQANAVLFNRKDRIHEDFLKMVMGFGVERFPKHYIPSPEGLYDAVSSGLGYGVVPEVQAKEELRQGHLVNLAPDHPLDVPLYWHHWSIEPKISKAVTRCVQDCATNSLRGNKANRVTGRRFSRSIDASTVYASAQ